MPVAVLSFIAAVFCVAYACHCAMKKRVLGAVGALLLCLLGSFTGVFLLILTV